MKRICIFLLLLPILCFCSCQETLKAPFFEEQEPSISEKLLQSIEGEYEKDSEKPEFTTTPGMIALNEKYADKWAAVAEEYYGKIISVIEDTEYYEHIIDIFGDSRDEKTNEIKNTLDKLNASYDEYAENRLEAYSQVAGLRYAGGSIFGPYYAAQRYELEKEYALILVGLYEELTFDIAGY